MAFNPRTDPRARASVAELVRKARAAARRGDCLDARAYQRAIDTKHSFTAKHGTGRRLGEYIGRHCGRKR